jgi:hypothetical protein
MAPALFIPFAFGAVTWAGLRGVIESVLMLPSFSLRSSCGKSGVPRQAAPAPRDKAMGAISALATTEEIAMDAVAYLRVSSRAQDFATQ